MVKISKREVKGIITKSNIPGVDYVINPYIGCLHGCIYCYAEFMIRFSGHKGEKWGDFLDIKKFDLSQIKPQKYNHNSILFSSVTDPYLSLEKKVENTHQILEKLLGTQAKITILTKSKFVTRDIALFTQFSNIEVGVSISTLDDDFAKLIEPRASSPTSRVLALKEIHNAGIPTYTFISPIFPGVTDFKTIIDATKSFTDRYMFENLNFRPHNTSRILNLISEIYPHLKLLYSELKTDNSYWTHLEAEIIQHCSRENLKYQIAFHHGGFSKS